MLQMTSKTGALDVASLEGVQRDEVCWNHRFFDTIPLTTLKLGGRECHIHLPPSSQCIVWFFGGMQYRPDGSCRILSAKIEREGTCSLL